MNFKFTPSQQVAFDFLYSFCCEDISDDQNKNEVILTGSPGYGKSFLIDRLQEECPNIIVTATTNKAANVVNGCTIYSLLGLTLKDDYKTGKTSIDYKKARFIKDEVIIIDECSMINYELFAAIHTFARHCKIIYVGDYYQLPPVNGGNFSIFNIGLKMLELTEPCRTDKADIISIMDKLKESIVNNTSYTNFPVSENVKYITDRQSLEDHLKKFKPNTDKCLSFTNDNVIAQNFLIRSLNNKGKNFAINDYIVCKSAVPTYSRGYEELSKIESVLNIVDIIKTYNSGISAIKTSDGCTFRVYLTPFSYANRLKALADEAKSKNNWKAYFEFKNSVLDIRDIYASTVHSSQGSTYRNVYIDINDLLKCGTDLQRLLYVAVSRAKENVYFVDVNP